MSASGSPEKNAPGSPGAGSALPSIAPDFVEQDFPDHLDNIIPSRGYQMLPMVGLGGSAGSIAALQKFFAAMPAQSGMVFVVIVHLSPAHESTLPELLGRSTTMRVVQAQDGDEVQANCVYVIPPGKYLASVDGHLRLTKLEPAVRHLEREIEQIKSRLRDTVEQYEASTEELKASNEELQALNEELRSATEELETSREELQSINEELTTVNQELKSKVDELSKANSDLANLMAATAIATIFLDRELNIMRYTPSTVALFHLIASDLGRPLMDLTHRLRYPELQKDAERVVQTLVPIKREVTDGTGQWFLVQLLPYRTAEDRIAGVVLTFVDITERQNKEEELSRSRAELEASLQETQSARQQAEDASRAKDRFLATLSHELRTPLTPVLTAAESMLRRKDLPPILVEGLQMICRNVELEMHFINDLLDLTRISRGKLELMRAPVDLHVAVERAVEISRPDMERKEQRLTVELGAGQHQLMGDLTRLQQVFWNLLKNASKFTPAHGEIRVTSRNEAGRIVVEVSDTGCGIDPAVLKNIFEAFQQGGDLITREFGGLGLGLAIAEAAVTAHGGTITAASEGRGNGSTFTVSLPLDSSTALPAKKP